MLLSRENKNVKLALKLKQKKYREIEHKFLAEGVRFVHEAIKEDKVDYILFSQKVYSNPECDRVLENDILKYEIDNSILEDLCSTETPQGVVAIVNKTAYELKNITNGLIVICDGIQDPGNLGTIIRTSDAAGAAAVVLTKGTVDVYNDKVLRSTMGSIFHIPIIIEEDFEKLINTLSEKGYKAYATCLEESTGIYDTKFGVKSAVIIGNEANGIPIEHIRLVENKIKIPMPGKAESLNAGIAAAVVIYEVLRQCL